MDKNVFDVKVRNVECRECGAPLCTAMTGGRARCEYCGSVNEISLRSSDSQGHGELSMADEVARLSRLQSQLEHPVAGHAYDMHRPPYGWEDFSKIGFQQQWDKLQKQWMIYKTQGATPPNDQRTAAWVSLRLADAYKQAEQPLRERAVLETALDVLPDSGHRQLVRCRLANEAVRKGELLSAEGWLAECDPVSEVLELDSAYREALARLKTYQNESTVVLSIIGTRPGEVPIHPSLETKAALLRAHALEISGNQGAADAQLLMLCGEDGEDLVVESLRSQRLATEGMKRLVRRQIGNLNKERNALEVGLSAIVFPLALTPVWAFVLFTAVTIPRCAADEDLMFGLPGYVLCPNRCEECRGPWRIYSSYTYFDGGRYYSPRYFCDTDENRIADMSYYKWRKDWEKYTDYELGFATMGFGYLFFLCLVVLMLPFNVMRLHVRNSKQRLMLTEKIRLLAADVGDSPPVEKSPAWGRSLLMALGWIGATIALAIMQIVFDTIP